MDIKSIAVEIEFCEMMRLISVTLLIHCRPWQVPQLFLFGGCFFDLSLIGVDWLARTSLCLNIICEPAKRAWVSSLVIT
jgi:hypothetical protein